MPLCFAAGGAVTALAISSFTLAWVHSIEKIRWEEDYVVEGQTLRLVEARVRGHGAGMEPPEGSWLAQGVWHYRPTVPPLAVLRLANSRFTAGYEFCDQGHCRPLAAVVPAADDTPVEISVCKP